MNNNAKVQVSVYCLAYNHEKYIRRTLDSFIMQKCSFRYEVIVHDDCSADHTAAVIEEYGKKYPEIIYPVYEKENQWSRNKGEINKKMNALAKGRYIAYCEGDDFWNDPFKLQKQYEALESHPECSMSAHKVICCDVDGKPDGREFPNRKHHIKGTQIIAGDRLAEAVLAEGYPFHTSSYFIRREARDLPLRYPNDEGTLRKALISGATYFIDEPMSTRRMEVPGSYNDWLQKTGMKEMLRVNRVYLEADAGFDEFTGRKYHDKIMKRRWQRILSVALLTKSSRTAAAWMKNYNLDLRRDRKVITAGMTKKRKLMYYGYLFCPDLTVWVISTLSGRLKKEKS